MDPRQAKFDALYDSEHSSVLRFILRRLPTGDLAKAEDLTHDVFLTAWRRLDEIPAIEPVARAWLFAVARNFLLNERRANARRGALEVRIAADTPNSIPGPADGIGHRLDLQKAWLTLSPADQEVLALAIWDGLQATAAGRALGISAGAYRFRLYKARRKLRQALDPEPSSQPEFPPDRILSSTT